MNIEIEWLPPFMAAFCFVCAGVGCIYLLITCIAVLHFPHSHKSLLQPEPVTVLKPLHGYEPDLSERLKSYCEQDYTAPVQIVCGLQDQTDSAFGAVRELPRDRPDIEVVIDTRSRGGNRKISNLANAIVRARHELLVISDSDIAVGPEHLAKVVSELQQPGVEAVSCLYHGVAGNDGWARYSALAINTRFLPDVIMALTLHLAQPCFGSTIAIRRTTLRRIGGLEAFADSLADDYAIGEAVRATGSRVVIPAFSVGHVCFQKSLRALLAHDVRAACTIKTIYPIGYYGTIITHPFPLALISAALGSYDAIALAVIALACRSLLCLCVEYRFGFARQPYWHIPNQELLSFSVFVISLFRKTVRWRDFSYQIDWNGRLRPDESGNQKILHNIKKGMRLDVARAFTKNCHELGITIHGTFILGLPGETKETIEETIRFATEIDPHTLQVSIAAPYPGTYLFRQALEEGWLDQEHAELIDDRGVQVAPFHYPHLSHQEIFHSVEDFYRRFYFRAPKIASICSEMIRSPAAMRRRLREGVEFFQFLRHHRESVH